MKKFFLIAVLLAGVALFGPARPALSQQPISDVNYALMMLSNADVMITARQYDKAVQYVSAVMKLKGLPEPILGRTYLTAGNIAFFKNNLPLAKEGFEIVLGLPGAEAAHKKSARQGLQMINDFRKNASPR